MGKLLDITMAGICGIAALTDFCSYGSKSPAPEFDMLKSASAYVQTDTSALKEKMDYARQTLDVIAKNSNLKIPELSGIEKKLSQIDDCVKSNINPEVYAPLVKSVGNDLYGIAAKYGQSGWDLVTGILFAAFAGIYAHSAMKKED